MQIGFSLVRDKLMLASELAPGDCTELQVKCPSCHNAVHKVGSLSTRSQYLRHFKDPVADCELRVHRILLAETARRGLYVRLPPVETLAGFMAKFGEIVMEQHPVPQFIAGTVRPYFTHMTRRPGYRPLVRDALASKHKDMVVARLVGAAIDGIPATVKKIAPLSEVANFLLASNSFGAALLAISYGAISLRAAQEIMDAASRDPRLEWVGKIIQCSDRELAKMLRDPRVVKSEFTAIVMHPFLLNFLIATARHFLVAVSEIHPC